MPRLVDRGMQVKRKRPSRRGKTAETGNEVEAETAADPGAGQHAGDAGRGGPWRERSKEQRRRCRHHR